MVLQIAACTPGFDDLERSDEGFANPTRHYLANCAWDAPGTPVMLHADARIEAACTQTGKPLTVTVTVSVLGGDLGLVPVALPFARWYDDLVET